MDHTHHCYTLLNTIDENDDGDNENVTINECNVNESKYSFAQCIEWYNKLSCCSIYFTC